MSRPLVFLVWLHGTQANKAFTQPRMVGFKGSSRFSDDERLRKLSRYARARILHKTGAASAFKPRDGADVDVARKPDRYLGHRTAQASS